MKIVSIPLNHQGKGVIFSRLKEIFKLMTCPEHIREEIIRIPKHIVKNCKVLDEHSILDVEVGEASDGSTLMMNFHLPRETRTDIRHYLNQLNSGQFKGHSATVEEAIEIGELPRYQVVFCWSLENKLPHESILSMQQHLYTGLGLSRADIRKLSDLDLTEILEKFREQQEELHRQKHQIQRALNKIEHDLEAAREAQMNLLPKELIGVDEVEFGSRFIPSQYVSGDIYNIFRLDEKNLGAYHIDISGHGVPAALYSVSLSQMLNTNISSRNLLKIPASEPPYYKINPPDAVFRMLDEEHTFGEFDIYFTMIYMVLDLETGNLSLARAGHNPPIIIRSDGEVEIPMEGSLPIGWGLQRDDTNLQVNLKAGDRIYLYSDGISDAFNEKEESFSQERIVKILRDNLDRPVETGLDRLINRLREFCSADSFEDDVSIIGLSLKG